MLALWNQVDDLLNDEFFRGRRGVPSFNPSIDIIETKGGYRLTADVPGLSADDIDITIENGNLILSGERKMEMSEEKHGYRHIERTYGQFRRTFTLPKGVDADGVQATVEHGVLVLEVPKPVAELPRKVKVAPRPAQLEDSGSQ